MKITLSVLAIAALAAVVPAHATTIAVNFTGTVFQSTGATGQAVGNTVTGHFDLDSISGNFLDFTVAGKSVAPGYTSMESFTQGNLNAIYTAQVSPVGQGTTNNSTFSLDLSSLLTAWPLTDTPITLLLDTNQLANNLDTINNPLSSNPSVFRYFTGSSTSTNVVSLGANLTSISASAVPEPASLSLVTCSLLGLGLFLRRRRRGVA